MKKNKFIIFIAIVMIFTLTACRNTSDSKNNDNSKISYANAFTEYQDKGYLYNGIGSEGDGSNNYLKAWFNSTDKTDCVLVSAKLTDDESTRWNDIDLLDDTAIRSFLETIPSNEVTVTSLNDKIPPQSELNKYNGKTLGDLESDGYEWLTDDEDSEGTSLRVYFNEDNNICLGIYIEGGTPDLFNMTDEDVAALKITAVKFWGFEG